MPGFARLKPANAVGQLHWLSLSALLMALDQWTKALISTRFELHETLRVLPVFNLVRAHNTGVAFSVFAEGSGWQRWVFSALALAVAAYLVNWLRTLPQRERLTACALSLVLAGALGNMIDRLRLGYVVDFIQWHWGEHYFPAFNVADSAISVGAGLLILEALLGARRARVGGG